MAYDKIDELYDALSKDGAVSKGRDNFRAKMLAPGKEGYQNRLQLYSALKADGAVSSPTYEAFAAKLGLHAVNGAQKPQQPQQQHKQQTQKPQGWTAEQRAKAEAQLEQNAYDNARLSRQWQQQSQNAKRMQQRAKHIGTDFAGDFRAKAEARMAGIATPEPNMLGRSNNAAKATGVVIGDDGRAYNQYETDDGSLTTNVGDVIQANDRRNLRERLNRHGLNPEKVNDDDIMKMYADEAYDAALRADKAANQQAVDEDAGRTPVETMRRAVTNYEGDDDQMRDAEREVKRAARMNPDAMVAEVMRRMPPSVLSRLRRSYGVYFEQHPKELKNGQNAQQAAEEAIKGSIYQHVYNKLVAAKAPKSTLEYIMRRIADQPLYSQHIANQTAAGAITGNHSQYLADEQAMSEYGDKHPVAGFFGTVGNMAGDPTTYVGGWLGGLASKAVARGIGKAVVKGATAKVAERLAGRTLAGRIAQGAAAGATNLGFYEGSQAAIRQDRTGEHSIGDVLAATGRGVLLGATTGVAAPIIGNVADKWVARTASTGGKLAVRTGETATSVLAEGTIFAAPELIENARLADGDPNKRSGWSIWAGRVGTMAGFKGQHLIKAAPRVLAELRTDGARRGVGFEGRLRDMLDRAPADLQMTKTDLQELRDRGYGGLADLYTPLGSAKVTKEEHKAGIQNPAVEQVEKPKDKDLDGYATMQRLMDDHSVSAAVRAKAYYLLTGKMLPMPTVLSYDRTANDDGTITITALGAENPVPAYGSGPKSEMKERGADVVVRKTFKSKKEADVYEAKVRRQIELNTVDVGEQLREAQVQDDALDAAIDELYPKGDRELLKNQYYGGKVKSIKDAIDKYLESQFTANSPHNPHTIRRGIEEEYGVDIDKALKKEPNRRTQNEQDAVMAYVDELYNFGGREEAAKAAEAKEVGGGGPAGVPPAGAASEETAENTTEQAREEGRKAWADNDNGDDDGPLQGAVDEKAARVHAALDHLNELFDEEAVAMIKENPEAMLNSPALSEEHKAAIREYMEADAALDGVKEAAQEAAEQNQAEVENEVVKSTNKETKLLMPATVKDDSGNPVSIYVVDGKLVLNTSGGIDPEKSAQTIVVYDPNTGQFRFVAPKDIVEMGQPVSPADAVQSATEAIQQRHNGIFDHAEQAAQQQKSLPAPTAEGGEGPTAPTAGGGKPKLPRGRKMVVKELKNLSEAKKPIDKLNAIAKILYNAKYGDEGAITPEEQALIGKTLAELKEEGYEIVDMWEGRPYDEGMKLSPDTEFKLVEGENVWGVQDGESKIVGVKKPEVWNMKDETTQYRIGPNGERIPYKTKGRLLQRAAAIVVTRDDTGWSITERELEETKGRLERLKKGQAPAKVIESLEQDVAALERQLAEEKKQAAVRGRLQSLFTNEEITAIRKDPFAMLELPGLSEEHKAAIREYIEAYDIKRKEPEGEGGAAGEGTPVSEGTPAGEGASEGKQPIAMGSGALGSIPKNEKGEPVYEQAEPATAWQAILEQAEGDAAMAAGVVDSMIADKEAAVKKAEKAKPKHADTIAGKIAAEKERKAAVERAKAELEAWKKIAAAKDEHAEAAKTQKAEEAKEQEQERHDAAVAQAEQDKAAQQRKEEEQQAVGTHAVSPKIKQKWDEANKIEGNANVITLPDGSQLRGHYVLTEAGAATASHDAENGFEPTEGFPVDENGQSVNDRDYSRDKDAQRMVGEMADNYDSRAVQSPVIVSQDGVVLSGNNRTMSGDIAAKQGTDKAYVEHLKEFGKMYGFTPEQIEAMKHPRVVFVPDEPLPYDAATFARFNAETQKRQSKPEAAVKLGKTVPDEVFSGIATTIGGYDKLSDFYADSNAVNEVLKRLLDAGVINEMQLPELRTGNALSAAGKELIENMLIGKAFQSAPDAVRQLIAEPNVKQAVVMALSEIAHNRTLEKSGYGLGQELAAAIDLVYRARRSNPDMYKNGVPVSPFGRQLGLFDEQGDQAVTDGAVLLLADILSSGKTSDLRKVLAAYNAEATESASGQADIFSGKVASKEEILKTVTEHFKNATRGEQKKLVDAAVGKRKQTAAELGGRGKEGEQTENADERGEESGSRKPAAGGRPNSGENPERQGDLAEAGEVKLSDKTDNNGHHFVLASDGSEEFGEITDDSGLTAAPIKLSEGFNYVDEKGKNHGYGLLHIQAEDRSKQILEAGFSTEQEFVEYVTKNYKEIRKGHDRKGNQTYMLLDVYDEKRKCTLYIELAKDGTYWTVNSGGIFRNKYSDNKDVIWPGPAVGSSANTGTTEVVDSPAEAAEGETVDRGGNSSQTTSGSKDSASGANVQEGGGNSAVAVKEKQQEKPKKDDDDDGPDGPTGGAAGGAAAGGNGKPAGGKGGGGYSIAPTTYTNKKGKTTDMSLLKFDHALTPEQERAINELAKEKTREGRFAPTRGWKDRESGGWMFRSEEDARKAAEMAGNKEAVADNQPLTAQELREAVGDTKPEKKEKKTKEADKPSEPTAPKEPAQPTEPAEPAEPQKPTTPSTTAEQPTEPAKEEKPKYEVSDEEMQSLMDDIRDILGIDDSEGDSGLLFRDPDELTPKERQKLMSVGQRLAMAMVERGKESFGEYAIAMVNALGNKVRPWLKAFYSGLEYVPGYEKYALTPHDEVRAFDVENFDKPHKSGIFAQAQMAVEEGKAQAAAAKANKELKEKRNEKRMAEEQGSKTPKLRPATAEDLEHAPVVYYEGKPQHILMLVRKGEQVSALGFSQPKITGVYLTNGKKVKLEELQVEDKPVEAGSEPVEGESSGKPAESSEDIADNPQSWVGRTFIYNGAKLVCKDVDGNYATFDNKATFMGMGFDVPTVQKYLKDGKLKVQGDKPQESGQSVETPAEQKAAAASDFGAYQAVYDNFIDGVEHKGLIPRIEAIKDNIAEAKRRLKVLEEGAATGINSDADMKRHEAAVEDAANKRDAYQAMLDHVKERMEATERSISTEIHRTFAEAVKNDMLSSLESGAKPYRGILDLRKRAKALGMDVDSDGRTDILLQELAEDGLVQAAKEVVKRYGNSKEAYDIVCKLYDMQPTIAARSSNRIKMQQYSTPLPMAWNASHFAMSGKEGGKVLEPTAGNGMLVFAVPAGQVHANELDETRLANLKEQGFAAVTQQDATEPFAGGKQYDVVIANPPFGKRAAAEYDGKMIGGLDPQITLNALASMKDDGRAAIIIGGNMEYADNGGIKNMKPFFTYLYDHYNVKGVVDMDGKLFAKQGTTFPTRMILIDGRRSEEDRAQSAVYPPVQSKAVRKAESFEDLYNIVDELTKSKEKTNGTEILRSQQGQLLPDAGGGAGRSDGRPNREQHPAHDGDGRRRGGHVVAAAPQSGKGFLRGEHRADTGNGATPRRAGGDKQGGGRGTDEPVVRRVDGMGVPADGVGLGSVHAEPRKRTLTEEKLAYRPHNTAFSLESVAPAAMVEAMDNVLTQIEGKYGNIDEFVTNELGYDTIDDAHNALAAEQMDSVAMAIYQMKQGQAMIIGDQTGVGKGRQMAALIRWAVKHGKKPIFITQKADLFSDIYRDLVDVGSGDLVPFIFNSPSGKENRGEMVDANGNIVYKGLSDAKMKKVMATGKLPEGCDYAVLTYSQVNTGDAISQEQAKNAARSSGRRIKKSKSTGKPTPKATFLRAIAKDNYLFLDESHTAAGSSNTGYYLQSIIRDAKAATFASATFAKRPDTMPLYAIRTAMSQAKVAPDKMIGIIEKGGVTLQEIMSRELTSSGQMVRRERDMSDVRTDWKTIDDAETVRRARENYDRTVTAFNAIIKFQEDYVKPMIESMSQELAARAGSAGVKRGTKKMGVENVPFASKAYNYTKQLMLALKVDAIAAEVEKEINAGRHPVIALESTMESSIKGYAAGEVVDEPTFSASLLRGLDSVMQYTIKDENGKPIPAQFTIADLSEEGEKAYYDLERLIRESTSDIFISPLDAIIDRLHKKGYKVGELTGRNLYVERNEDGKVVVRRRTDKDKKRMQREFNNGELDVLILNKSASTGISLHASEKFSDKRQRSMIIAQPLSDINDYMQMIGRIDRTGQVHRGYYINLGLPVPAENRFLMMLSTKLKSLNANTTTSQDSESNEVDAPDLLNKYGSQVVVEYLRDNPDIYEKMGLPLKNGKDNVKASELDDYKPQDDDARKITGYVALLSTKEQEDFYDDVVKRYNELITYLNDTGNNDLKITVMPLRAKTIEKHVSSEGKDPNGDNPFAKDSYVEKVEMDVLRKPMKASEVRKTIEQVCKGQQPKDRLRSIITTIDEEDEARKEAENARYEKARQKAQADIAKYNDKINGQQKRTAEEKQSAIATHTAEVNERVESKHDAAIERIDFNHRLLVSRLNMFETGRSYLVPDDLETRLYNSTSPAIFCGYKSKDSKITASTTFAVFATLDGRRRVEVKLSRPDSLGSIRKATDDNWDAAQSTTLDNWDSQIPTESRKEGYIMTGNILQAIADTQDEAGGYPGQLISYTDINGDIHDGILMPDKWSPAQLRTSGVPLIARLEQIREFQPIVSQDGKVEITGSQWARQYYLTVPKSKKDGAKYYENRALLKMAGGNFYPYHGKLRADIDADNIGVVVKELTKLGVKARDESQFGGGDPDEGKRFRLLDDDDPQARELESLGDDELVPVYRNVQVFDDDSLGSPMAFSDAVTGERRRLEGGKWNYSEPREVKLTPEQQRQLDELNRNGYLVVGGKKTTELPISKSLKFVKPKNGDATLQYHLKKSPEDSGLWAAYNPYDHAVETPLNTQFAEAYKRPNLVVVRSLVPKSELEGHFKAPYAKDSTGAHKWNNGRTLYLSRYSKIDKVLTREEEAKLIDEYWKKNPGKREALASHRDYRRFVPEVRKALEKMGYRFELDGKELTPEEAQELDRQQVNAEPAIPGEEGRVPRVGPEDIARINAKMSGKWVGEPKETMAQSMVRRVKELAAKLGVKVRIVTSADELAKSPSRRQRKMKGMYDIRTGEVIIVIGNHENLADVENTVLHEVVGHRGFRILFKTKEAFDHAMDELYRVSSEKIRKWIDDKARKLYDDEVDRIMASKKKERSARGEDPSEHHLEDMMAAHIEASKKKDQFRREATDEYGAHLAGRIGEKGFEKLSAEEQTFWGRLKSMLQKALQRLAEGLNITGKHEWTDKDWAYVLHEAYKREKNGGKPSIFDEADTIAMRMRTGFGEGKEERKMTTLSGEEAKRALNEIFSEKSQTAKPEKISSLARFREIFNKPIRTFLGEVIKVKDAVWGKILREKRQNISGAILPTLQNADFAIRDTDGSILYVKRFLDSTGEKTYNVAVVNKHGELEDYISSVHIKNNNNLLNKIEKGAELLIPENRNGYGHEVPSSSTPDAKIDIENESGNTFGLNKDKKSSDENPDEGMMFRDGDDDDIGDVDLGLGDAVDKMREAAVESNANNLQAKREAMKAIGGNLSKLRQAMARQKVYDKGTVKSVTDMAREMLKNGMLDKLSSYEAKRILSAAANVTGAENTTKQINKLMDVMVDNQLRNAGDTFGKLLHSKGTRVNASGVEVQGQLDPDGAATVDALKKGVQLDKEELNGRISKALDNIGSEDKATADQAANELAGLQLASRYVEDIKGSKAEEAELRESLKDAKTQKDAGKMSADAYKQYCEATEDAIRQNKIERADAYRQLIAQLGGVMGESAERAKAWREAEKQRVQDIQHNANSDMQGRPCNEHHKPSSLQKLCNSSVVRFFLQPLGTFEQMLRMFGNKNVHGEGYLWNRFVRGWLGASENEYSGYRDALKELDDKVSEIFGKKMRWGDIFSLERKLPTMEVKFWDGGELKPHTLTQGNLAYIYMVDKMSDGRMKLRAMGITEGVVEQIAKALDPRLKKLADWMQDEFLVQRRNKYNEVHKRMFGASMAAIENYFPLKILSGARTENVDVSDDTGEPTLTSTTTGSIIKRRRNNLALDVTNADAFSVILEHLQDMEHWAAYSEFNRDLNTLLSYKRFKNQVMNMSSAYGAGATLWKNFRNVCQMAAGSYRPPVAPLDKAAVNFAKGVTAAKVSFRIFTALKQLLSFPAYLPDASAKYLLQNLANPVGAWKWSMENLPLFHKRWNSRMAGDPRLLKTEMDWKMWRSRVVQLASKYGMSPNAFVDAVTVAMGAHAIYKTKLAKYLKQGYDKDKAEEKARQDAEIAYNQTQQSSEGAFLSTMQADRSWFSVLFTVFRNSAMSYTRQEYDALRNLARKITKPQYKQMSIEFMAKQMVRDGLDEATAWRNAQREYHTMGHEFARVVTFGLILQMAWNLGAYLPYLLLGDNDDDKKKMLEDAGLHALVGSVEGLTGGDVMSAAGQMGLTGEGNPEHLSKDMPLTSDLLSIYQKWGSDKVAATNDVLNLLVQAGVGVNPQSLTDAVVGVMDYCENNPADARECALLIARIFNTPQSQLDKIYFDEIDLDGSDARKLSPKQIAERYAKYKLRRNAPLTAWMYGEDGRKERVAKYKKAANDAAKERLSALTDSRSGEDFTDWRDEYEQTAKKWGLINGLKDPDPDQYMAERKQIAGTPADTRYRIENRYKARINKLTNAWLKAKTPAERMKLADAMVALKKDEAKHLAEGK